MLTFYPNDLRVVSGGIRMVALNLVEGLRAYEDVELHVVHCHSDIASERTDLDGRVTVRYLAMPRRRLVPNLVTSIGRLTRVLGEIQPDLVHAHAAHFAYAGTRAGYPTLLTIHGVLSRQREVYTRTLYDRARYALLAHYERLALRGVRQVVAISPYVVDEYRAWGSSSWVRIDNPVPRSFFDLPDAAEPGRVLYVGSTDERKDLLMLLRAMERVRDAHPGVQLRIAGHVTSRDYERRVRAHIRDHGLADTVHILGLLDRDQMLEEYARCTVLALASIEENSPMAVIEASAAAKPVVATAVGGVPDLVCDGENGYLVPAGDAAALAERLVRVLNDPGLARRLGRRGRALAAERFSVERVAQQYHALYQRMVL